jgi:hypothetical protein
MNCRKSQKKIINPQFDEIMMKVLVIEYWNLLFIWKLVLEIWNFIVLQILLMSRLIICFDVAPGHNTLGFGTLR